MKMIMSADLFALVRNDCVFLSATVSSFLASFFVGAVHPLPVSLTEIESS